MNMTFAKQDDVGVIHVGETRIDAGMAIAFKDRFRALVDGAQGDIVLDLSTVEFLDSSGLGAVVAARKLLGSGRTLALAGLTPAVNKVMTLTRMNMVFPIYDDCGAAVAGQSTAVAK